MIRVKMIVGIPPGIRQFRILEGRDVPLKSYLPPRSPAIVLARKLDPQVIRGNNPFAKV